MGDAMGRTAARTPARTLTLLSLCATTFFIVSGGPYGLEEIVLGHGYARALLLLLAVPLLWALPVGLMVGELGSAIPETGGYYVWVRRGCGRFWGLQEAWLTIATSLFDMAIYPTLFVTYLARMWPVLGDTTIGKPGWWLGVSMIAICAAWNIVGSRAVGVGATLLGFVLLAPFVAIVVLAAMSLAHGGGETARAMLLAPAPSSEGAGSSAWIAGVMICMWNYMGWDNASTVASEVKDPQRVYPRAMLLTLVAVIACYTLSILAATAVGLPPEEWSTGAWVEIARRLGGPTLAWLVVVCGAISAFGMFNALVMSCSRLPVALADDRLLPRAFARRSARTQAPVLAIVVAAGCYAACMGLGLTRLMEIDVMLYGAGLVLEFVALIALRVREPALPRPFRIGGGLAGVIAISIPPTALLATAIWLGRNEIAFGAVTSLQLATALMLFGLVWYAADRVVHRGSVTTARRDA